MPEEFRWSIFSGHFLKSSIGEFKTFLLNGVIVWCHCLMSLGATLTFVSPNCFVTNFSHQQGKFQLLVLRSKLIALICAVRTPI